MDVDRDALLALAERCEKATGADDRLDDQIGRTIGVIWSFQHNALRYTASLDSAITLVLEGWNWMAGNRNQPLARAYVNNDEMAFEGAGLRRNPKRRWFETIAATPSLALCAAALRSRAAL